MSETNGINPLGSIIYGMIALCISSVLICVHVIWEYIRDRIRKKIKQL